MILTGTSTDKPVALQNKPAQVPTEFAAHQLLVRGMPGGLSYACKQGLKSLSAVEITQTVDANVLQSGAALPVPGGKQMELVTLDKKWVMRIKDAEPGQNFKPCMEATFNSAAKFDLLTTETITMTGMNRCCAESSKLLKTMSVTAGVHSEKSFEVYGIPSKMVKTGVTDSVPYVGEIGFVLTRRF